METRGSLCFLCMEGLVSFLEETLEREGMDGGDWVDAEVRGGWIRGRLRFDGRGGGGGGVYGIPGIRCTVTERRWDTDVNRTILEGMEGLMRLGYDLGFLGLEDGRWKGVLTRWRRQFEGRGVRVRGEGRLEREMRRERMGEYVRRMGGRRHGRLVYILLKVVCD